MKKPLLILLFSVIPVAGFTQNVLNAVIASQSNRDSIVLYVGYTNSGNKPIPISKERTFGFSSGKEFDIGNYLIELQRVLPRQSIDVFPTADNNPVFVAADTTSLIPNQSISDTIVVFGRTFSTLASRQFPIGQYRVRVSFKFFGFDKSIVARTTWIPVTIE